MDLSDLKIFCAVVREGSVTKAAQRLHRVQSNVTTRIRQLEENVGIALFVREGKRLHLSPAGQVLLDGDDIYDPMKRLTDARRQIGMVFQKPNPFPAMSIEENVLAGLKLTATKASRSEKDDLVESMNLNIQSSKSQGFSP